MFRFYNPNPKNRSIEDCVIRAISKVTNQSWDDTFIGVTMAAFTVKDMPSSGRAWGEYLKDIGFERTNIPNSCPNCYTVRDFCSDNRFGTFLLVTNSHVVAAVDGNYYDTWDSGDEIVISFWKRRN